MAFETVNTEAVLQDCVRKGKAWDIISDYTRYPSIMENVDKVEIIERSEREGISKWYVTVEEAPLYWVERDYFNRNGYEIIFRSIEGDFDNINGRWKILDGIGNGIIIKFEIHYNLGIPVIEEVLGRVLKEKMKSNIDRMIAAVKKELCAAPADERKYKRYAIGHPSHFSLAGSTTRLFIHNLSAGGMMTRFAPELESCGSIEVASERLELASVFADKEADRCRLVFREPLNDALLNRLVNQLALKPHRRAA